jgi:hypothetical protein
MPRSDLRLEDALAYAIRVSHVSRVFLGCSRRIQSNKPMDILIDVFQNEPKKHEKHEKPIPDYRNVMN